MKSIAVVTSFDKAGYDLYGKNFLESFDANWPDEVDLHVHTTQETVNQGIFGRPDAIWFLEECEDLNKFKRENDHDTAKGVDSTGKYHMKYDAIKFAHKSFALLDTLEVSDADVVFWLDADTITHSKIDMKTLQSWTGHPMLEPDTHVYTRYLGREQNPKPMYSECGFVMYNTKHQKHKLFINGWRNHYTSGSIFVLPEWHDSFIYDRMRRDVLSEGESASWTSHLADATTHPFIQVFGNWMDHKKGPRKESRSCNHELRVQSNADYWK